MEPNSSDQRPWYQFTLTKLLVATTLVALSLGLLGVTATLRLAICILGWFAATQAFPVVALRWGQALGMVVVLLIAVLVVVVVIAIELASM